MIPFKELCESLRKSMLEMGSADTFEAGALSFLQNCEKLQPLFMLAGLEKAKEKGSKEPFAHVTLLLDIGKNITQFLITQNAKNTDQLSLRFLQSHIKNIHLIFSAHAKLDIIKTRSGFKTQWYAYLLELGSIEKQLPLIQSRIAMIEAENEKNSLSLEPSDSEDAGLEDETVLAQASTWQDCEQDFEIEESKGKKEAESIQDDAPLGSLSPTEDLKQRFQEIIEKLDNSASLEDVSQALAILQHCIHQQNLKEDEELCALIFNEQLKNLFENIETSLRILIASSGELEQALTLRHCVIGLKSIVNHPNFVINAKCLDLGDMDDVIQTLEEDMSGNILFSQLAERDKSESKARDENENNAQEVEAELLSKNCLPQALLHYYKEQQDLGHVWSKEALLYLLGYFASARNQYQATFDRAYAGSDRETDQENWLQIEADIKQEKSLVRDVIEKVTNLLESFDLPEISRLCLHLSDCRIFHPGLFSRLQEVLKNQFLNFEFDHLERASRETCDKAAFSMMSVRHLKMPAPSNTTSKILSRLSGLEHNYPFVNVIANVADFFEKMRGNDTAFIQRILMLATIAVSDTVTKAMLGDDEEEGAVAAAASIGKLAHSLGILSHYLPTDGTGADADIAKTIIRCLHRAILLYGKRVTLQILKDNNMHEGALVQYKRGIHSMAKQTQAYVDPEELAQHQGFLTECLRAEQRFKNNNKELTRFEENVGRSIIKACKLKESNEQQGMIARSVVGDNCLYHEAMIGTFQYDFLLQYNGRLYTIEANGQSYHYLIEMFSDSRRANFNLLDGKSLLKHNLVHDKNLIIFKGGARFCQSGESGMTAIAIDISQVAYEIAKRNGQDCNFVTKLLRSDRITRDLSCGLVQKQERRTSNERRRLHKLKDKAAVPRPQQHKVTVQTQPPRAMTSDFEQAFSKGIKIFEAERERAKQEASDSALAYARQESVKQNKVCEPKPMSLTAVPLSQAPRISPAEVFEQKRKREYDELHMLHQNDILLGNDIFRWMHLKNDAMMANLKADQSMASPSQRQSIKLQTFTNYQRAEQNLHQLRKQRENQRGLIALKFNMILQDSLVQDESNRSPSEVFEQKRRKENDEYLLLLQVEIDLGNDILKWLQLKNDAMMANLNADRFMASPAQIQSIKLQALMNYQRAEQKLVQLQKQREKQRELIAIKFNMIMQNYGVQDGCSRSARDSFAFKPVEPVLGQPRALPRQSYTRSAQFPYVPPLPLADLARDPAPSPRVDAVQDLAASSGVDAVRDPASSPRVDAVQYPASSLRVDAVQYPAPSTRVDAVQYPAPSPRVDTVKYPVPSPRVDAVQYPAPSPRVVDAVQYPAPSPRVDAVQYPAPSPRVDAVQYPAPSPRVDAVLALSSSVAVPVSRVASGSKDTVAGEKSHSASPFSASQVQSMESSELLPLEIRRVSSETDRLPENDTRALLFGQQAKIVAITKTSETTETLSENESQLTCLQSPVGKT